MILLSMNTANYTYYAYYLGYYYSEDVLQCN